MSFFVEPPRRERAINAPPVVLALLGVLVAIHVVLTVIVPDWQEWAVIYGALIPIRFTDTNPLGFGLASLTLVSHAMLHGSAMHITVNGLWLLIGGARVARVSGPGRFLALFFACAVAGGLAHLVTNWASFIPMLGASGGIAGLMAAAMRIHYALPGAGEVVAPLGRGPVRSFTAFWLVSNLAIGLWDSLGFGPVSGLAWQAHIGGYLAGLALVTEAVRPRESA